MTEAEAPRLCPAKRLATCFPDVGALSLIIAGAVHCPHVTARAGRAYAHTSLRAQLGSPCHQRLLPPTRCAGGRPAARQGGRAGCRECGSGQGGQDARAGRACGGHHPRWGPAPSPLHSGPRLCGRQGAGKGGGWEARCACWLRPVSHPAGTSILPTHNTAARHADRGDASGPLALTCTKALRPPPALP